MKWRLSNMKSKLLVYFFIMILILTVIGINLAFGQEKKMYHVGIISNNYPFAHIDYHKDGSPAGFDVESIQWIGNEMDFEIQIIPMTKVEFIPRLLSKEIDLVYSGITITEERKQKVDFSNVYWVVNQVVVAGEEDNLDMENFYAGQYVIGTMKGSNAAKWIKNNLLNTGILPQENLKLYDNFPQAINDLLEKKIQAAVITESIFTNLKLDQPLKKIGTVSTEEFGIAIRKEDVELKSMMNEGLKKLMASPKWEELIKKYEMK